MKRIRPYSLIITFIVTLLFYTVQLKAQPETSSGLKLDVKEHVLKNGLKVLMIEKHDVPIFSAILTYKVGSVNEHPGITGVSHLLEHMMFKGTKLFGTKDYEAEEPIIKKIDKLELQLIEEKAKGKGADTEKIKKIEDELAKLFEKQREYIVADEMWSIYLRYGGTGLNASTANDNTNYYVSLPSNKLELWAFIESDRMQNLVLREFYPERDVVMEERRLRTENSPFGLFIEQLNAVSFIAHPYSWPVVGWRSDIQNITKEQTLEYFKRYYAPNNAVISIVGDINPEEVISIIEKYFGNIPSQPAPPAVITVEPEQLGERRVYIEFDANPQLAVAYHKPAIGHPDQYVLEVIEAVLSHGRTSRLYKSMVEEKRIAVSARAYAGLAKYPDTFTFFLTPRQPHTIDEVEAALYEEIDKLKATPPTEWELQKIKNQLEADFIRSLESVTGLAGEIAYYEAIYDWGYINTLVDNIKAVTAEDVMRVANQYFTKNNRTVAILVKKEKATENKQ
ncbi:MAG TPA: M16 family metallopeptidase [Candidatus Brocadiia bacterium]|nr:pitrilysin family protein [Candidatus Brocadiales bacterium]